MPFVFSCDSSYIFHKLGVDIMMRECYLSYRND